MGWKHYLHLLTIGIKADIDFINKTKKQKLFCYLLVCCLPLSSRKSLF